mmetsp:Transcript_12848/g.30055  ORF Transcript_12848/g.30055 Transcript_12848/m.30055 type:complete len:252 (-) Transcript_12848:3220-3975(-)
MAAAVAGQETLDAADGLAQVIDIGQEDQAEVVVLGPVEAGALHDQHLLLGQQLVGELLVVGDRVDLGVQAREHVERRLRLDDANARDLREQLVGQVALVAQPAGRGDEILDALVAAQGCLDRELARGVRAQAQRGQHVQALDVVTRMALLAADHHPAGAVAAAAVVLGQAVERDDEHIVGQRRQRGVGVAVVQGLVVDLVGEHDQLMPAGELEEAEQQVVGVERAGRVVRVADHDAAGARRDLGLDVRQVR